MMDEKLALLRARRNNIRRYNRLLKTNLTELERQFIEKRLSEDGLRWKMSLRRRFPSASKFRRLRA